MRSAALPYPSYPEEIRSRYRELGYWTEETFAGFVADRTGRFADNTAVVGRDAHGAEVRWTYADLAEHADLAARRLASAGVTAGDRVVVTLPNIAEYVACVLGLFGMGAVPVFALPTHREAELAQFCAIADAAALVVCGDTAGVDHVGLHKLVADRLAEMAVEPPVLVDVQAWPTDAEAAALPVVPPSTATAETLAFLQLSGGTTGISKLIPRAAAEYLYSVRASADICDLDEQTVMLVVLPASHNFPMSSPGILGVLHVGGTVVLAQDPSPRTGFGLIERERATMTALVPPLAQAWISAAKRRHPDLASLEIVQVGGARLNDVVATEIEPVLHGRLQQVFGMAEGLVNYTRLDDSDELVLATQGRPISPDDEVRVVDEDGADVPDGAEGALLTRGPYTIRGYYGGPTWTASVNAASFTADGFYRTGDLVRRLPSGHLVVTGRDKDQINRGGEKIATDEIEGHLLAHPDVLDAVAVGVPDHYLGERICVVVRTESGRPRPADLGRYLCDAGLATYKIPDSFVFLDDFPATHVGKNSRRELRRLLGAHLNDQTSTTDLTDATDGN